MQARQKERYHSSMLNFSIGIVGMVLVIIIQLLTG